MHQLRSQTQINGCYEEIQWVMGWETEQLWPSVLWDSDTQHWMESPCSIICQQQRSHPSTSPWSSLSSRCYYFWRNNYFCERVSHTFRSFLQLPPMTYISVMHFRKVVLLLVVEVCVLMTVITGHRQSSACHWCTWNDFCALGIIFPTSCCLKVGC